MWLDSTADSTGLSKSEIIRQSLDYFAMGVTPDFVTDAEQPSEQPHDESMQRLERLAAVADADPDDVEGGLIGTVDVDDDDDQEDTDDVDAGAVDPADLPAVPDDLEDRISALAPPGSENKQQRRREGVRLSLAFLIHRQEAYRSEFEAFLDRDDVPHGYASGHSAYKNYINEALKDLAADDDRLRPSAARDPWRWDG